MSLTGLRYGGLLCRRCHLITMMTPKKALNIISQSHLSSATQSPQHTATKRSLLFPSQSIHLQQRGIFNQTTSSIIYESDLKSTAIGFTPKSGIYFNHRSFHIYSRKHQASIDAEGTGSASKAGEEKEQKKSRWSNWTGKNAWKGGILLLFLYVVPLGVFIVCSYGEFRV